MLEYCDKDSRLAMIHIIYRDYIEAKKKTCVYGIPNLDIITDWENYRCDWLLTNIVKPLEDVKNG